MPAANIGIPAVRSDGPTADFQPDGRFILVQPVWGPQELVPHCTPICLCGTAILTAWFLGPGLGPFQGQFWEVSVKRRRNTGLVCH
jgi:hypothetical protein